MDDGYFSTFLTFIGRRVKALGYIVLAITILIFSAFVVRQVLIVAGLTAFLGFSFFKSDRNFRTIAAFCVFAIFWVFLAIAIAYFIKLDTQISEMKKESDCHSAASKSVIVISFLNEGFDHQRVNRDIYYSLNHGGILEGNAGLVFRLVDHLNELESSEIHELDGSPYADRINYLEQKCLSWRESASLHKRFKGQRMN